MNKYKNIANRNKEEFKLIYLKSKETYKLLCVEYHNKTISDTDKIYLSELCEYLNKYEEFYNLIWKMNNSQKIIQDFKDFTLEVEKAKKQENNLEHIKAKVRLLNDKELSEFFAWVEDFKK